jgi:hypothetical protein
MAGEDPSRRLPWWRRLLEDNTPEPTVPGNTFARITRVQERVREIWRWSAGWHPPSWWRRHLSMLLEVADAILDQHEPVPDGTRLVCKTDGMEWPCAAFEPLAQVMLR